MGKIRSCFFMLSCVLLLLFGASAEAITTSADDGDDVPGAPDVRRVTHVDNGGDVAFYVEFFENHDNSKSWPARSTCTWDLDFNNNDKNVEMLVIFAPSATSKVYRITYRSGGPDKTVDPPVSQAHQAAPTGGSSTPNNTIRVPVPKSEMISRGLPANATSYRARSNCSYSGAPGPGSSTGTDYVPDNRLFGITHTFGAAPTAAPTAAPAAAPTPTPTPAAAPAATATVAPSPTATANDDDSGVPAAAVAGGAAGAAVLIGGGIAYAMWRRRKNEEG